MNFTFLVDGHTEMMRQIHALQSRRIYECVIRWIGSDKENKCKKEEHLLKSEQKKNSDSQVT